MIEFNKLTQEAAVLSPITQFQPDVQTMEYRWDPLTGWKQNYNVRYVEKAAMFVRPADEKLMAEMAEISKATCPFCPQNVDKTTPKFLPDIVPEGRIQRGETWIVPNLFLIYDFTVVAVLTKAHFLKLDEFSPAIFNNGLRATLEFFRMVHDKKPECQYPVIGMNYLPPAGSTQFHPHLQVYLNRVPYQFIDYVVRRSETYYQNNSMNYWQELVETEKKNGERYLGRINNIEWLVPFCPMGQNEVQGIICGKSNFLEFEDDDIEALSDGICRTLKLYQDEMGASAFNFLIYSGPLGKKSEGFWSHIKITSRPNLVAGYANDIHLGQLFYLESWYPSLPETVASLAKKYFGG